MTEPSLPEVTSPSTFTAPTAPVFPTIPTIPPPSVAAPSSGTPAEGSEPVVDVEPNMSTPSPVQETTSTLEEKKDTSGADESSYLPVTTSTIVQTSTVPKSVQGESELLINTAGAAIGVLAAVCVAVGYVKMKKP